MTDLSERNEHMRKILLAAFAALSFGAFAPAVSQAMPLAPAGGLLPATAQIGIVEDAQAIFFLDGRRYCWHWDGWNGPGYYRCGYEWRRGRGWGGSSGWRGRRYSGPRPSVRGGRYDGRRGGRSEGRRDGDSRRGGRSEGRRDGGSRRGGRSEGRRDGGSRSSGRPTGRRDGGSGRSGRSGSRD